MPLLINNDSKNASISWNKRVQVFFLVKYAIPLSNTVCVQGYRHTGYSLYNGLTSCTDRIGHIFFNRSFSQLTLFFTALRWHLKAISHHILTDTVELRRLRVWNMGININRIGYQPLVWYFLLSSTLLRHMHHISDNRGDSGVVCTLNDSLPEVKVLCM